VTFKELEVRNLTKTLRLLFQSLIKDLTEFMKSEDLIRMSIQCPELDFPITIPFMKVSQLSTETLLREIERVLQSYEQFVLDSSLEIDITHVDMPSGAGRKHTLRSFFVGKAMYNSNLRPGRSVLCQSSNYCKCKTR
jgi:hypothetical protein